MTRRDVLFAGGVYLGTRVGLLLVAWAALAWIPLELTEHQWQGFPTAPWLDGWARFDSAWYRSIFEHGYAYTPGQQSNVNFFPLYAWLAGLLSLPLRSALGEPENSFYLVAIGLSHACSLAATLGLHLLVRERLGRAAADRAVWLLCLYPFSFYLGAAYSEGLFLALAIGAFCLADRERWGPACLLASLAAVTRIPGFLVAVGLALEYLRRHGASPRGWSPAALWLLVTPVPLLLLMASFAVRFDDPLVFVATQRASWGRELGVDLPEYWALLTGGGLSMAGRAIAAWRIALVLLVPFGVVLAWRRLGLALGAYTLLAAALPVTNGIEAIERYLLAAFPIFAALGAGLRSRLALGLTLAAFLPWLVYFTAQFARWGPIAAGPG